MRQLRWTPSPTESCLTDTIFIFNKYFAAANFRNRYNMLRLTDSHALLTLDDVYMTSAETERILK